MNKYIFLLSILVPQLFATCVCCPKVSCIPVDISLTESTNNSKSGITKEDLKLANNWSDVTNQKLQKIKKLQIENKNLKQKIQNIKESLIISKFKQNYYLKYINSSGEKDLLLLKNKLLELEKNLGLINAK